MSQPLFERAPAYCYRCGTPSTAGALVCESCGGGDFTRGGTRPTEQVSNDSLRLPWPWDGLGAFPSGSVVALTGGPGSGKSTITAALDVATWGTTEQTPMQVGAFFRRLEQPVPTVWPCTGPASVRDALRETDRGLFVLDSLTQIGGWVEQAAVLHTITAWARSAPHRWGIVILQINARGEAAGLLELPHMVDACTSVSVDSVGGLRTLAASKNRHGPLFSRLFGLGARGVETLGTLAESASYSVEGSPGGYYLHPWPMPGAKWAGLLDKRKPPTGYASAAIVAPSYARGVLEPADVRERRDYAEAHGLVWLEPELQDPETIPSGRPVAEPSISGKAPRKPSTRKPRK